MFNFEYLLRQNIKNQKKKEHEWPDSEKKIRKESVTKEQLKEFRYLVKHRATEIDLHTFLEKNEAIFAFALKDYHTGHHGLWVYSKQEIQPRIKNKNIKGMIPDFIIGGENSNGHEWFVVELKGANEKIFNSNPHSISFTSVANRGLCQLIEYTDTCCEIQSHLRDHFRMRDFREPKGILIIGTDEEFKERRKQKMKRAVNKNFNKNFEIRTYNWLLRNFEEEMRYRK
ncbi:DUF4263 domain-containing protein [Flavobacteriaceae bacterium R38]|nr:DUF4263 domain-containing protein [Flavobacteriaceae bacterium R38]